MSGRNQATGLIGVGLLLLLSPVIARTEVVVKAAVNGASFVDSKLPNGKLSPGSLIAIFGDGLGPDELTQSTTFPLPTELAGTRVSTTVDGTTRDCLIIYSSSQQVGAILPSSVPSGPGTLTIRYNGQSSPPLSIEMIPHDFGIFSIFANGSGFGVFTDPFTNEVPSMISSVHPGQLLDIWGTGMGAVNGDEAARPLPGDLIGLDVHVIVGDKPAQVLYRGRSGCCAGVDQLRFVVPAGITGCYAPVHVEVDGIPSNYVSLAIAESGSYCDSPGGLTASELQSTVQNGALAQGQLTLSTYIDETVSPAAAVSYAASDFFFSAAGDVTGAPSFPMVFPSGSCSVGDSLFVWSSVNFRMAVDTGPVKLSGPPGTFELHASDLSDDELIPFGLGHYSLTFLPGYPEPLPGIVRDGTLLTPGDYRFTSAGGTYSGQFPHINVPPFDIPMSIPVPLESTVRDLPSEIDRSKPLTISWTNASPDSFIEISGTSVYDARPEDHLPGAGPNGQPAFRIYLRSFVCWTSGASVSFTVPAAILGNMPASGVSPIGEDVNGIGIAQWQFPGHLTLSGIDVVRRISLSSDAKAVRFR